MFHRIMSFIILAAAVAFIVGCVELDPQTKTQVHQVQQKNAVDVAKVQAEAKLKSAKAAADPLLHPLTANADAAKQARGAFLPVAVISLLVLGGFIGLCFTPLSWVSKIGLPIAAGVCGVSWLGVFALPFLPWVAIGVGVAVLGLFVYELSRAHWKLPAALKAIENDLGIATQKKANQFATAAHMKASEALSAISSPAELAGTSAAPIVTVEPLGQ